MIIAHVLIASRSVEEESSISRVQADQDGIVQVHCHEAEKAQQEEGCAK